MNRYDECDLAVKEYVKDGTTIESFEDDFDGVSINGVSCRSEIKYLSHKAAVDAGREFIDTHMGSSPFNKWLCLHRYQTRCDNHAFYWVATLHGENITSDLVGSLTLADSNGRQLLRTIYDIENNQKEATK